MIVGYCHHTILKHTCMHYRDGCATTKVTKCADMTNLQTFLIIFQTWTPKPVPSAQISQQYHHYPSWEYSQAHNLQWKHLHTEIGGAAMRMLIIGLTSGAECDDSSLAEGIRERSRVVPFVRHWPCCCSYDRWHDQSKDKDGSRFHFVIVWQNVMWLYCTS